MADKNPGFEGLGSFEIADDFMPSEDFLSTFVDEDDIKVSSPKEEKPKEVKSATPVKVPTTSTKETPKEEAKQEEAKKEDDVDILDVIEDDDGESKEDKEEENPQDNIFSSVAADLFQAGIFQKEEGEEVTISTPDELLERFIVEKKRGAEEIVDKFLDHKGEDAREYFEAVFVNGIDPRTFLERRVKIEDLSAINLGLESDQEKVVREYYTKIGRPKEFIEKKIEKLKNNGELQEEAEEAHPELLRIENENLEKEKELAQQKTEQEKIRRDNYVNQVNKIISDKLKAEQFDGIPVDQEFAKNIFTYVTAQRWQLPDGRYISDFEKELLLLKEPANYEKLVKYAMLIQMEKSDPTFSRIQKKAISKETKANFTNLARLNKTKSRTQEEPASKWNL